MDEGAKMFKMFRMMGVIGITILVLAIFSSGCAPQAIETNGGKEENVPGSVTPSGATEVTEASSDVTGVNV